MRWAAVGPQPLATGNNARSHRIPPGQSRLTHSGANNLNLERSRDRTGCDHYDERHERANNTYHHSVAIAFAMCQANHREQRDDRAESVDCTLMIHSHRRQVSMIFAVRDGR
ncbi:hypothetical protein SAMN05446635_7987 [Burkholderia sp. OK233]|nr:hypothetical protein SAMN05446635_7987 [Burkholderia sp. OK233]